MDLAAWLEASLIVNRELAEAVAEVMARFAEKGVVIESTAIADSPDGPGVPVGPLRVCGYLPVNEDLEETRQRLEEALWHLGQIEPLPPPTFKLIQETNWMEAWKVHYRPIPIGHRLLILPAWMQPTDEKRIPILIEPGMAFGTGTHPTTQLCLELLEDYVPEGDAVIDVGCGSGILSIAAAKLGARPVLGVDTDKKAIPSARENAAANGVVDMIEFRLGSVAEILAGGFPLQRAPVVVANILAPVLIKLLEAGLGELVSPGGVLVLSGILEEKEDEMQEALRRFKFNIIDQCQIDDWIALIAKPGQP